MSDHLQIWGKKNCRVKAPIKKYKMKSFKPSLGSLLESIQSSMKFTDPIKTRVADKTRRLFHVYVFFEKAIEKNIIKIKLAQGDGQWENYTNCCRFNDMTKCIMKNKSGTWWNLLATKRALFLFTKPSELFLTLKTHLQPTSWRFGGGGTKDQVLLEQRAWNSSP